MGDLSQVLKYVQNVGREQPTWSSSKKIHNSKEKEQFCNSDAELWTEGKTHQSIAQMRYAQFDSNKNFPGFSG